MCGVSDANLTNEVNVSIDRAVPPEGVPAILRFSLSECASDPLNQVLFVCGPPTGAETQYAAFTVYNPRVPGRTLQLRWQFYNSSNSVTNDVPLNMPETSLTQSYLSYNLNGVGVGRGSGPYRVVGTIRKVEGSTVLYQDSRTLTFP